MDVPAKESNRPPSPMKLKELSEMNQQGFTMSEDGIVSMNGQVFGTIAIPKNEFCKEEPLDEVEKKRSREKNRKDKIRQGIQKLSDLLPPEFHSKEGQKETLVAILEKAAEYMKMKAGEEVTSGQPADGDELTAMKANLSGLTSGKVSDLGDMEATFSMITSQSSNHNSSLESSSEKLQNNNALDMVPNENQENSMGLSGNSQVPLGKWDQGLGSIPGLSESPFIPSMGSGMFGEGPLLPSLMSPMLPGNQLTSMQNMMSQYANINSGVNMNAVSGSQQTTNNTAPLNTYNTDSGLFMTQSSDVTTVTSSNVLDSNVTSESNNALQELDAKQTDTTQLQQVNTSIQSTSTEMQYPSTVNTQASNLGIDAGTNSITQMPGNLTNLTNLVNATIGQNPSSSASVRGSAPVSHATSFMSQANTHVTTSLVMSQSNTSAFIMSQPGSMATLQAPLATTLTTVSNNVNMPIMAANQQQKPIVNNVNNLQTLGQTPMGSIQPNMVMPSIPGAPMGALQGTLVLHNGQLILLPNNNNNTQPGLPIGQNMQGGLIQTNQGAFQTGIPMQPMNAGATNVVNQGVLQGGIPGMPKPLINTAPRMLGVNQGGIIQTANGQVIQTAPGVIQGNMVAQQQAGAVGSNTFTVNTPQGVVQMNTTPSAPNQLPSALMLPNGQIVPVVSQANQNLVANNAGQLQPGSNVLVPAQAINQNQLTIQTPGGLTGNQIMNGTGLLMTTSSQSIKPASLSTTANSSKAGTLHYLPVAAGNTVVAPQSKQPVMIASIGAKPAMPVGVRQQISLPGMKNTIGVVHSVQSQSASLQIKGSKAATKALTTTAGMGGVKGSQAGLPNTIQAMLTSDGNIILMSAGAQPVAGGGKMMLNKKGGQRIIMPKPASGTPVATIAPLLPGQPTSVMVTSSVATTLSTVAKSSLNTGASLSVPVTAQASMELPTPPNCAQSQIANTGATTDILAKATESIFQASPVGGMSPHMYNPANDDNPLQIDTGTGGDPAMHCINSMGQTVASGIHAVQSQPVAQGGTLASLQAGTLPNLTPSQTVSSNTTGAKPKSKPRPKTVKTTKKKSNKTVNANKKNASSEQINNINTGVPHTSFSQQMSSEFCMPTDSFMPDLADSLDDGDDESDINDFSDLIRLHAPRTATVTPISQQPQMSVPESTQPLPESTQSVPESTQNLLENSQNTAQTFMPQTVVTSSDGTSRVSESVVAVTSSVSEVMTTSSSLSFVTSTSSVSPSSTCSSVPSALQNVVASVSPPPQKSHSQQSPNKDKVSDKELPSSTQNIESAIDTSHLQEQPLQQSKKLSEQLQSASSVTSQGVLNQFNESEAVACETFTGPNDIMGLTPMEIIQSIADSTSKEKSPKEKKEPSPRISLKKLTKAGKDRDPTKESPKKSLGNNAEESAQSTPLTHKPVGDNACPVEEKADDISPAKSDQEVINKFNAEAVHSEELRLSEVTPEPVTENVPEAQEEKQSPKASKKSKDKADKEKKRQKSKERSKAGRQKEQEPLADELPSSTKQSPKVESQRKQKGSPEKLAVENKTPEKRTPEKKNPEKQTLEKKSPEKPVLEKVESKAKPEKQQTQEVLKNNPEGKTSDPSENIFMAAVCDKSDLFRPGSSLFSQPLQSGIPPFTSALPPPHPFGFGAPAFFPLPMMTSASPMPAFGHIPPMFPQHPLFATTSFGELPFKPLSGLSPRTEPIPQSDHTKNSTRKDVDSVVKPAMECNKRDLSKSPRVPEVSATLSDSRQSNFDKGVGDNARLLDKDTSRKDKKKSKKERKRNKSNSIQREQDFQGSSDTRVPSEQMNLAQIEPGGESINESNIARGETVQKAAGSETGVESALTDELNTSFTQSELDTSVDSKGKRKNKKKKKDKRCKKERNEYEIVEHSLFHQKTADNESETAKTIESENSQSVFSSNVQKELENPVSDVTENPKRGRGRGRKKGKSVPSESHVEKNTPAEQPLAELTSPSSKQPLDPSLFLPELDAAKQPEGEAGDTCTTTRRKSYSLRGKHPSLRSDDTFTSTDVEESERNPSLSSPAHLVIEEKQCDSFTSNKDTSVEMEPEVDAAKKSKSKGRGRSRSKRGAKQSNEAELSEGERPGVYSQESEGNYGVHATKREEVSQKGGLKLKISNRHPLDASSPLGMSSPSHEPEPSGREKTGRSYRPSQSPPKKSMASPSTKARGRRSSVSPSKKGLSSSAKLLSQPSKGVLSSPTPKSIDVFDFDDEPDETLPTSLKSFASMTKSKPTDLLPTIPVIPVEMDKAKEQSQQQDNSAKKHVLQPEKPGRKGSKKRKTKKELQVEAQEESEKSEYEIVSSEPIAEPVMEPEPKSKGRRSRSKKKLKEDGKETVRLTIDIPVNTEDFSEHGAAMGPCESETGEPEAKAVDNRRSSRSKTRRTGRGRTEEQAEEAVENAERQNDDVFKGDSRTTVSQDERSTRSPLRQGSKEGLARPLEQTIQALHQRLKSTSPIRPFPVDVHPLAFEKEGRAGKRVRQDSQAEALDLSCQEAAIGAGKAADQLKVMTKKGRLLAGQTDNQHGKPEVDELDRGCKRSRKSKRKAKGSISLECDNAQPAASHPEEETNLASKRQKLDETQENLPSSPEKPVENIQTGDPSNDTSSQPSKEHRKSRKRSHSLREKDTPPSMEIPETITFDEKEIYAVLDQVETADTSEREGGLCIDESAGSLPDVSPAKKSKLDDAADAEETKEIAESGAKEESANGGAEVQAEESRAEDRNSGQENSPSKKEKKREKKKRRKEKLEVRDVQADPELKEGLIVSDPKPDTVESTDTDLSGPSISTHDTVSSVVTNTSGSSITASTAQSTGCSASTPPYPTYSASTMSYPQFKMPQPVSADTLPLKGNPPKPIERSSTSHLVARIPKKRIDAYQMYENATKQAENSTGDSNQTSSVSKEQSPEKPTVESVTESAPEIEAQHKGAESTEAANEADGTNSEANSDEQFKSNPPVSASEFMAPSAIEKDDRLKEPDLLKNKFTDFDFIPPSPLSSARHSHLGQLAQVSRMRTASIVMPASPRTPLSHIGSARTSGKKDKEREDKAGKSDTTQPEPRQKEDCDSSLGGKDVEGLQGMDSQSVMSDKISEKESEKDRQLSTPPPYSAELSEPLFSPPSILPHDSMHNEHEHSPPPAPPESHDTHNSQHEKPKETAPPPPPPPPPPAQTMYGNNFMDTAQGVDLSQQRDMFSQGSSNSSSTCAMQNKQSAYDSFSPPYAGSSAGPSPSMAQGNPGSNQMLSPNISNAASTPSYTASSSTSQMSSHGQPHYPAYYPMQSGGHGNQQQSAGPGPPPPLTMQSAYGMETSSQREPQRQQNRTPVMSNSDRMTSPHPANQPKPSYSYLQDASNSHSSQHGQQREPQRLTHPEKENRSHSQRSQNSASQMSNQASNHTSQHARNRSTSVGRSPSMGSDSRSYYAQSSYPQGQNPTNMTSPPLHHRGPAPNEQRSSSQRSSYETPYPAASAYASLATYSYDTPSLSANSQSSQNHSAQKSAQQNSASSGAKNLSTKQQSQSQQRQSHQQTINQSQQVKSNSHSRSSSVSSKSSKKSSSKTQYDSAGVDPGMMNLYDRSMTPYHFPFSNLPSPSGRNYQAENPYLMFGNHQRSSQHKNSDPFNMFHASRTQNGLGFNWGGHHGNHASTSQASHSNSSAAHLSSFTNFPNLFPEMNSSAQDGFNMSPLKLPHSNLLSQHGMDHNAALQHQWSNRGQMAPSMLHQHHMSFLGHHQHPGFDGRSMGAAGINSSMAGAFGGHGHASFSMPPFLPGDH